MAQPPHSTTTPAPEPGEQPRSIAGLPAGFIFRPRSRCLVDSYLVPRVLHGRLPGNVLPDAVAEGVDVYTARPEALPFPRCNRRRHEDSGEAVWGYFFTTRPAAGGDARDVAAGGRWCRTGAADKGYAGDHDGEVYALRTRFAYYDGGGRLTPWQMKEYRLNEGAARFRGVAFHPSANNLVVWKVCYKEEVPVEEPAVEDYSSDDSDEDEVKAPMRKRIKVGRPIAIPGATGA